MLKEKQLDFPLAQAERELLATISFDLPDGYEAVRRNGEAVCALMKSLNRPQGDPRTSARKVGGISEPFDAQFAQAHLDFDRNIFLAARM